MSLPTDEKISALAMKHYLAVGNDHHKDRDCHWSVEKRWSYGEFVGYFIQHAGYVYEGCGRDGEDGPFATYGEAARELERHMRRASEEAARV